MASELKSECKSSSDPKPEPEQWQSNVMVNLMHMCNNFHVLTNVDDPHIDGKSRVDLNYAVKQSREFTALEEKWFYNSYEKLDAFWKSQEEGPPARLDGLVNQGILTCEEGATMLALAREIAERDAARSSGSSFAASYLATLGMVKKFYLRPKKVLRPRVAKVTA